MHTCLLRVQDCFQVIETNYYNINGKTFKIRLSAVLQDWPEMDSSQFKKMVLSKDLLHRALTDKLPQSKTIDNAGLNNNISNRIAYIFTCILALPTRSFPLV